MTARVLRQLRSLLVSAAQLLVVAPLIIVATVAMWAALPLWLIAAGLISPVVPGWARPVRLLWVFVLYMSLESLMLIEFFGQWLASGFGLFMKRPFFQRAHYDIAETVLTIFVREARRVLRLKIETVGPAPDAFPGSPLLVMSRHAGMGDSFILIYALMRWYAREPRIVLKATLTWDPAIGVLLSRVPSRFIGGHLADVRRPLEEVVGELASDLDDNDAFVIFPEGGNFTPDRRQRGIDRLRAAGWTRMADRAESMEHVLAPRPGGVLAALDAAPGVDVLLVAHTGLDHVRTAKDAWRSLPMDKQILMGWWRIPREGIPEGRDERIEWLYGWWEYIDKWVAEHKTTDLGPPQLRLRSSRS